jgi:subtilisin-like proprotein convertase family protein
MSHSLQTLTMRAVVLTTGLVLALATPLTYAGPAKHGNALTVPVEIMPGVADKVLDTALAERISVAILSGPALNAREVDATSLSVSGAAVTKREDGSLASYRDVDGDGRLDLVVDVASSMMRLGARSTRVFLVGRTLDGRPILGTANLRTVAAVRAERRLAVRANPAAEKRPPVPIAIDILPGDPSNRIELGNRGTVEVAILSAPGFDATAVDPAMVNFAGSPATRRKTGGMASVEDVNADGRPDLVVEVPKRFLRLAYGSTQATLRALAPDGRILEGTDRMQLGDKTTMTFDSDSLTPAPPPGPAFSEPAGITIIDKSPAGPYPSTLLVSGVSGVISKVRVTLKNLTHGFPNDIDVLLVGPTGQSLILMSDVGGTTPGVANVNLTFDDDSAATLDSVSNPSTGYYQPANIGTGDTFPPPAPSPSAATSLSVFNGTNPNGLWSLFVVDDTALDSGVIADGWSVDFITATEFCNSGSIAIVDVAPALPYPSSLTVSGLPVAVSKVALKIKGLSHTYPDDIDMLLVGPGGNRAIVMSDAGGLSPGVTNVNLTFDDNAALTLDMLNNPPSGTYRPIDFDPGDILPAPAPGGFYSSILYQFDGMDPNGSWALFIADDASGDTGIIAGGWCLDITTMTPVAHSNPRLVTIPAGAPSTSLGIASPYPSTINVSGVERVIAKVSVTLDGLSHTYPQDLDVLLVSPAGQNVLLMSDVGGATPGVSGVTLVFDDAGVPIPLLANPASGIYAPTNDDFSGPDVFPAPAPGGPYGSLLSDFNFMDLNGSWALYIYDDQSGDVGSLASGWSLSIQTFLEPSNSYPPFSYCNFTSMTIPNGAPGTTSGPASLYQSPIFMGFPSDLSQYKVVVDLLGLTHSSPADLDILLTEVGGREVMLMSDVGGGALGVTNLDLTFDDDAANSIPVVTSPLTGLYKPTNNDDGFADSFPAPCCFGASPTGPFSPNLSAFKGIQNPSGWYLWVLDDTAGDTGSMNGWCIRFIPSPPPGEVPNLRWPDRTTLVWDAAVSASSYNLFRGDRSDLPALLDHAIDSCPRGTTFQQQFTGLAETPVPGAFFWYLVRGHNAQGDGPPGFDRNGGLELARIEDPGGGFCP